ncbi:PA2169 family four-helix-bundle protein [Azospirillum sp. TSO22-1]|uniref:PA2169 family four-helix-bundle protein n=1 Tax=Azospirillum sp. TSO22-1 TaxID=716789 RepID=UPI001FFF9263|nr:PA2169 family four-helix-bundle protein [Azospirillum sp. TSO22-1]
MMGKNEIVDTLNDLIRIVQDSHEGYQQAAESGEDDDLQALFSDLAAQRGAIVRELQRLVAGQGGAPDIGGTLVGGAHRFFLGLRAAVMGHDREAILGEVQRGEAECVRLYDEALAKDLPPEIAGVVRQHLGRIRTDLDRMAALRDTAA